MARYKIFGKHKLYYTPYCHLELSEINWGNPRYRISYSVEEYQLMYLLARKLKNEDCNKEVAFLGLGPGIGPALTRLRFLNLDVYEWDETIIKFVEQEHPEYLKGYRLIIGDWIEKIIRKYDIIIFDIDLPENISDETKDILSSHLNPGGFIVTQPEWKRLEL